MVRLGLNSIGKKEGLFELDALEKRLSIDAFGVQ